MSDEGIKQVLDRLDSLENMLQSVQTELYRQSNPQDEAAIKMKARQDLESIRKRRATR